MVLVVDVSKSTAYAALRHVTLCSRPRVRCTCPEQESSETEIMGQPILSCALPLALDLMSGAHAADCISRHLQSLNHE